eukprot:GHVP01060705.1.p1 GENE.GHVP01060705.1~~GHVP01060705.1.p1  ORF type:complete len:296 (+),score=49.31 GHVP01060705.1:125-1012(+)
MKDSGKENVGLSPSDVRSLYGQPQDFEIGSLEHVHLACLDDRQRENSIFTPGGDVGEFILMAHVFLSFNPKIFTQDLSIGKLLEAYITKMPSSRRFYHCTDQMSIERIELKLGMSALELDSVPSWKADEVLSSLSDFRNIGDLHIHHLLKESSTYQVLPSTVLEVLHTYFSILWNKESDLHKKLYLDVFFDKHDPQAFLEVEEGQNCIGAHQSILFASDVTHVDLKRKQSYINHMKASQSKRKDLANFFLDQLSNQDVPTEDEILTRAERYYIHWLEATGKKISKNLPFYVLTFE